VSFRTFSKSLIAFIVVALSSYLLEVRLHREGIPSYYLILISNFLVGLVAAALVYVLSIREKHRQEYIECRLRVIAEMNHHIRNALQVISFYSRKGEKQEIGMREAVERIQWALREVLPQLPNSMPVAQASDRVLDIQKLRSAEFSRR
jgi:1,2-phenylacetyl-CoA epoxidase catalytic subunit